MRALCLLLTLSATMPLGVLSAQADSVRTRPPAIVTVGDLGWLAGAGLLAGAAYAADAPVRDAVRGRAPQSNQVLRVASDFGYVYGGGAAVAVGAALWTGGLLTKHETVAASGLRALEAIAVSGLITKTVKGVTGRARPRVAPHERDEFDIGGGWGGIDGNRASLPSGHATAAFAFAAAVTGEVALRAPEHRRSVAIVTYGLGVVTAYSRVHDDAHWLSDVTLGAGIGMVSGWAVTRWHATRPDNWVDRLLLRPDVSRSADGGMRLGLVMATR